MDPFISPGGNIGGAGGTGGVRLTITCPTPVITSTSTLICGSSGITLSVNSPVTGVIYQWYKEGITTTTTGATYTATAAGNYTVKAEYTIDLGTPSGNPTFSPALSGGAIISDASNEIILTEGPEVILNPYMGTFCSGENVVIDPKETTYGNTIPAGTTFEWSVASNTGVTIPAASGSGSNIAFGQLINITNAKQTVVYNVTPSAGICSGTVATFTIEVNPEISVYLYSNFDSYCDGSNATLTAAALPEGVYTYTYEWYLDNVLVTGESDKTLTSALTARATPYMYYVIAKSTTCPSSKSNEIFIKVNNKPVVNITLDHTDIAVGGIIKATASVMPSGDYDYVWYLDGLPKGYEKELILNDLSLGSHNIQVTAEPVKESNGCLAESSVVAITIHDKPYIELSPNSQTICIGGTATVLASFDPLTPIPPEIDGKYTYEWILGGKLIKGAIYESYTHKFDDSGTYEFKARLLIDNGNEKTVITDWSSTAIVVVLPEIKVMLFPDKDIYCEGDAVTITVRTEPDVSGDARYEYHWLIDGKLAGTTNENATTFTGILSREAPYKVSVIVEHKAEGCTSESNEVSFTVKEVPQVAITVDHDMIAVGGVINAVANVKNADNGNYNYNWYIKGSPDKYIGTGKTIAITDLAEGDYELILSVEPAEGKDNCTAWTSIIIKVYDKPFIVIAADPSTICIEETAELKVDFSKSNIPTVIDGERTYEWMLDGKVIEGAISESYIHKFDEPGTYKFQARLLIDNGNEKTVITDWSTHVTVEVLPLPEVTLVIDRESFCEDGTITATVNVLPVLPAGYQYEWFLDGKFASKTNVNTITTDPGYIQSRETPYNVYVIVKPTTPGAGCEGKSNEVSFTVKEDLEAAITVDHTDIAFGGVINAFANVEPSDGNYNFRWFIKDSGDTSSDPGEFIGTQQSIALKNFSAGEYRLSVSIEPTSGKDGCFVWRSTLIRVHNKPYIIIAADTTICVGGTANLWVFDESSIPPEIDGEHSYEWMLRGKLIEGAISDSYTHKFIEPGEYEFQARLLIDNSNEKIVITDWSNVVTITVLSPPDATLVVNRESFCVDGTITATVNVLPELPTGYQYEWFLDGKFVNKTNVNTITTDPGYIQSRETPYNVYVIVKPTTPGAGCEGKSNEVSFLVKDVPQVAITVDYTEIIVGGKITAFANVAPSDGSYDFIWYLDDEMVGYQQELVLDFPSEGTYTLRVTATPTTGKDGCKAFSVPVKITVYDKPEIEISGGDIIICVGQIAELAIKDIDWDENAVYSFQWELNGVLIPGATSDSYSPTFYEEGEYKIRVRMEINYGQTVLTKWSNYVTVTVQEIPNVMLVGDNNHYCEGSSVTLIANTIPAGDYVYDWYLDNVLIDCPDCHGNILTSGGLPVRAIPYTYYVIARTKAGCEGISNNFTVEVDALPFVIITTDYDDIGVGGSVTATANVLPTGEYDYTWYFKDLQDKNPEYKPYGYKQELILSNLPAGIYDIYVKATPTAGYNGCENNSAAVRITVHDKPYVLIGAVSKTICAGETAELFTSSVVIDKEVNGERTYQWALNGVVIPEAIMSTYRQTLTEPGTYVFNMRILVDYGLTFTSGWSNSITITVQKLPNVLLVGDDDSFCYGSSIQLTAEATPTGSYVYDWYLDNKYIRTTSGNTYLSKDLSPRATPYTYYVIARSVPGGCEGISNEFSITVRPVPTVTVITNYTDICPGGSITATAKVLPVGEYNYTWYCNKSVVGFDREVTISNLPTGKYQIYVQVSNASDYNGCDVTSSPVTITVHGNPIVTIAADKEAICAGEMAFIRTTKIVLDNVVRSENRFTYEWAVNGIIIPNASQSTYSQILTVPGRYEYTMRMIQNNDFGCSSEWSTPAIVIVEAIPQVSLMVENVTYCAGSSTLLKAAVIPAGKYEYDWYRDDILVLKDGGNTYSSSEPSRATAYSYHVVVRTAIGCESVSNKVSVNVKTAPTVAVVTNNTDMCPGGSITATANVLPVGDYNYIWYIDDVVVGFNRELIIKNLSTGSYNVYVEVSSVADYNGCTTSSKPFSITVHDNPVVTIAADNTLICGRGTVTLSVTNVTLNTAVREDNYFTYQWAVNGSIINGAERNTYTQMLEAGVYEFTARVVQNNSFACASDWSKPVTVVVMSAEVPSFFTTDCNEGNIGAYHTVHLPVTFHTGSPQNYSINFMDVTQRSLNISGRIQNNNSLEVHLPLRAGDYEMEIRIDGCLYTTTGRVMVDTYALGGAKLIESRWNDVLIVNNNPETNGGFTFYSFQWYKNGVIIPGANKQTYTEPDGVLNGEYHVELHGYAKLGNGNTVEVSYVSCPFKPSAKFNITVYPVPVKQNQPLILDTSLSEDELKGATLEIFNAIGMLQRKITNLSPQMSIPGFTTSDVYLGRLVTLNSGIQNFRFIVAQ